jgi:hypothetical protein
MLYVYIDVRLDTNKVFYVGQGDLKQHCTKLRAAWVLRKARAIADVQAKP